MSLPTGYVLHGFMLPASAFVSQITDGRLIGSPLASTQFAAGFPQPLALHVLGVRPQILFNTKQLVTVLAFTGTFGGSHSASNVDFYLKKASDLGVRVADGTTEHLRYRSVEGMLCWTSLAVAQDGEAILGCRYVPTYDGTNAPLVPAGSVAVAGTPVASEVFTLGPVKFGGSQIFGVQSVSLELGHSTYEVAADGEPYLGFFGVREIEPVLTIRGPNAVNQLTYGLAGTAISSSWSVALRRLAADGGHVANGTASHIILSGSAGIIEPLENAGNGNELVQSELRVRLRAVSGGANAISVATGQTIT